MKTFIITFPQTDVERKDGWVKVINARDAEQVKSYARGTYNNKYAFVYEEEYFQKDSEGYYPKGCLEVIDFRMWHDYVV